MRFDFNARHSTSSAFLEAMGKLSAEGRESGMPIISGQLSGADASARVRLAAGKIGVSDGPFPWAKEVIGGYAILEYPARNSGRCNIDFQSVTGRQNAARALMPTGSQPMLQR